MQDLKGDLSVLDKPVAGNNGVSLISAMHDIQEKYSYLPEEVLRELAAETDTPLIEIYRIATFYKHFSLTPKGKHRIVSCTGTACHVRGIEVVNTEVSRLLGVEPGSTTADGKYSLETVNCLGACALAPLVVIDGEYYGNMTASRIRKIIRKHDKKTEKTACSCSSSAK